MKSSLLICICLSFLMFAGTLPAQDIFDSYDGYIHRPELQCNVVSNVCIPRVCDISANIGDLIEIDVSRIVVPGVPAVEITFSGTGAIREAFLGTRIINQPGIMGSGMVGAFFRAVKAGSDTIVLSVAGQQFEYPVTVLPKRQKGH